MNWSRMILLWMPHKVNYTMIGTGAKTDSVLFHQNKGFTTMKNTILHIIRGCGNLPYVGEHPGTLWLFFMVFMAAFIGLDRSLLHALGGAAIMASIFGPVYLVGAYHRSIDSENMGKRYRARSK